MKKQVKRIMIAGTGSGSGKTTLVCGILQCFLRRGIFPSAFKCGPDYIDPMFHREVLGVSAGNLDGFFCEDSTLRYLLAENTGVGSVAVIEGVMGYFDGIGMTERASSFAVAAATETPVVLVIGCRGMAASVKAILRGYVESEPEGRQCIRGVIFNMLPESLYEGAAAFARELGLVPLGFVPQRKDIFLRSRHLGLVMPGETQDFGQRLAFLADMLEETVDIDGLLSIAEHAPQIVYENIWESVEKLPEKLRVGVARDEAFCFLYRDNLDFLLRAGCEPVYFSPIRDRGLPGDIGLLLLCGGYPELYAAELSANVTMRDAVRVWVEERRPCIAECGGFLYLHEELEDSDGRAYPMACAMPGRGVRRQQLGNFGYIGLTAQRDNLLCRKGEKLRAHEFHYWSCEDNGDVFLAEKASNGKSWPTAEADEGMYAGFPHLYFYGDMKRYMGVLRKSTNSFRAF